MKEHDLKVWHQYYAKLETAEKTFEVRKDDRGFEEGDILLLREFNPQTQEYSGKSLKRQVTYILRGPDWDIPEGCVVMAIHPVGEVYYVEGVRHDCFVRANSEKQAIENAIHSVGDWESPSAYKIGWIFPRDQKP